MQQVTPNVYVETKWRGANTTFVVTKQGVVIIDTPQRPSNAIAWRKEIANRGEVRYLINTEPHYDHFTGNHFFSGIVISHEETRRGILGASVEGVRERVQRIDPDELAFIDKYQLRIPTITFSVQLSLYLGDHTFHLLHLPGHTLGQTAVYIPEERVVCTGDNIFHKCQTFLHQSDPAQWLESLKKIEEMDVDVIVPGHGEVCDKSYIPEQRSFIQEWLDTVKKAIEQGLSKEQAMDRISFLDRYPMDVGLDWIGPEVQRWNVERLYDLLTR